MKLANELCDGYLRIAWQKVESNQLLSPALNTLPDFKTLRIVPGSAILIAIGTNNSYKINDSYKLSPIST
ncbi:MULTISPECIES: hypothetical protein [Nostoc]|uniref:Uncharacterized protein n=2 Tax=Nostoc TaxID=1177 RepID=A0ABR8I5P0_9NOSO|nr:MULTISPECIES: hypothetical protein [Nostoc]MBD2561134.1 hypothetical protein [Nostoc linckia FACHB-391]MBD2646053.1 hypothetical protein [Nostoc foliaceum FACHB-393]